MTEPLTVYIPSGNDQVIEVKGIPDQPWLTAIYDSL